MQRQLSLYKPSDDIWDSGQAALLHGRKWDKGPGCSVNQGHGKNGCLHIIAAIITVTPKSVHAMQHVVS
ncbi:hypothetical protein JOB18_015005 [Solea senegalensis]|uniref:Uncharacterized protein n=1 Tax=Solea senegalensis TaxID=28829 RepID=A0AAV6QN83_SOLSE|nr:hypothetical protein JOB18_015005 [Solea senegalensis]